MRVALSQISLKSLLSYYHPYGLMSLADRHPFARFSTLLRVGGAGYKTLGKVDHFLPPKYERIKLIYQKMHYPLEFILGRFRPLSPYLSGFLYDKVLRTMVPRDPILPSCFP
ncbi:hypothetical protein P3X46_034081 [Hevea brasiliensis]|uniref:Uncharacterized protein n=1 Tax=Hevea brasiliensis TaxID=3981 RepID=A0ABQ9KAC8_HEVBR|nr:hypothetical protein P3X46_034081 [Hevea brasiliensis]